MQLNNTTDTNYTALAQTGRSTLPRGNEVKPQPATSAFPTPDERVPEGEDARREYVQMAAESYKAVFPMSGMSFAIFKDSSSGEFITRFTNLADGTVTQIPEPELINFYMRQGGGEAPLVSLQS